MPSDSKIEKALKQASAKVEHAGIWSKENGNLEPFADPLAREPIDETVHLFLKEAVKTPCLQVVRSLESNQMRPSRQKIFNGFGAASALTKAPYGRGIIPITGMYMRSNLEIEGQKKVTSDEAKANLLEERFPVFQTGEILENFSEIGKAQELTTALIGRTPELIQFRPTMTQGIMGGMCLPFIEGGLLGGVLIYQAICDKIEVRRRSATIQRTWSAKRP